MRLLSSRTDCLINSVDNGIIDRRSTKYCGSKEQEPLILSACRGEEGKKEKSSFKEEIVVELLERL